MNWKGLKQTNRRKFLSSWSSYFDSLKHIDHVNLLKYCAEYKERHAKEMQIRINGNDLNLTFQAVDVYRVINHNARIYYLDS